MSKQDPALNREMAGRGPLNLELVGLYDCARLSSELRISRRAAEHIMRAVPGQGVPGLRKSYVRGGDVEAYLNEHVIKDAA